VSIRERDVKLLWGRAASRCAFAECRRHLTQDSSIAKDAFTLGEMAHVVAKEDDGPRGASGLSRELRDSYSNLILLCPTTIIDQDPEAYPVALLHVIKDEHETWVQERLTPTSAQAAAVEYLYADLIDQLSLDLIENWITITEGPLSPTPYWLRTNMHRVRRFRERILRAPWPAIHPEFETSLIRLSLVLMTALEHFEVHADWRRAEQSDEVIFQDRFYERASSEERYHQLSREHDQWIDREYELLREATKALNWSSDCVRRYVNPFFRLVQGYALAYEGDGINDERTLYLYEPHEIAAIQEDVVRGLHRALRPMEKAWEHMHQAGESAASHDGPGHFGS
jgi:hypothetical protein